MQPPLSLLPEPRDLYGRGRHNSDHGCAPEAVGKQKGFIPEWYRRLGDDLDTVKRSITLAAERYHVEVTTLLVPGENDSVQEVRALAQWLASVSPDILLNLSRFFPRYQMQNHPPTPVEQVYRLAQEAGNWLTCAYAGNC